MSEKIVLIDGHSILNRAFFGIPDLTNAEGLHTNAVYGFLNILFKILDEEKPEYLTVAFDVHAPTFRHKMYDAYKGTRKPMAEELRQQVPLIKEMLAAMGIRTIEKEGYEADDLLGTLSVLGEKAGMEVSVVSGDRDLLQLATDHVKIRIPKTKRTGTTIEDYYAADVKERYQVTPQEFIDVKALMGDTADNIPGVPGIGEKTATALIVSYGSIENAHDHLEEIRPNRARENLNAYYDQAQLSKTLATIDVHAEIEFSFEEAKLSDLYTKKAYELCRRLEFKNMLSRFSQEEKPQDEIADHFVCLSDFAEAEQYLAAAKKAERIGLAPATDGTDLVGAAICLGREQIAYIPAEGFMTETYLAERLKDLCLNCSTAVFDLKQIIHLLDLPTGDGAWRKRLSDCGIAAYLLNPLTGSYPAEDVAKNYLDLLIPSKEDLFGKKKPQAVRTEMPEQFFRYHCYIACTAFLAEEVLLSRLEETGMKDLFDQIEMPLVYALADMEKSGIAADREALLAYGEQLAERIAKLEQEIYAKAGEVFNINSPKQLGVILFEKLQLPNGKKTKTGYSTAADVLDKLAPDYPVVADILEYRQLAKLKSTYADSLAEDIAADGRIHSTFHQTITATGRISSTEPNLQNIPIRMELGRLIRKVFYPAENCIFVDADYSQIELRVLAHMSGDEQLIQAYREAKDIHRTTASQVFHIPFEEVTDLQRRNAKAVNFGIVYGISAFGLSQDLNISRKEAADYIDRYFETYPRIKQFLDRLVTDAKEKGYSVTLFGRRRPVPELSSSNFMQRSFGERVAMNAPIQGTAADIIKIAMIRVHDRLAEEQLRSRLILQVHDELLIEAEKEELSRVETILAEEMHHAADLAVQLEIDMHTGTDWYEAK